MGPNEGNAVMNRPMIRNRRSIAPALLALPIACSLLSGCLAKAAVDIATAPVRVAGRAVDIATTSQSEADEARGRDMREREEQLGKLERRYDKQRRRCDDGDRDACKDARETYAEIEDLAPSIPPAPRRR